MSAFHNAAAFEKDPELAGEGPQLSDTETADERTVTSLGLEDTDSGVVALPLTGGHRSGQSHARISHLYNKSGLSVCLLYVRGGLVGYGTL